MMKNANISIKELTKGFAPKLHGKSRGKPSDEGSSESSSSDSSSSSDTSVSAGSAGRRAMGSGLQAPATPLEGGELRGGHSTSKSSTHKKYMMHNRGKGTNRASNTTSPAQRRGQKRAATYRKKNETFRVAKHVVGGHRDVRIVSVRISRR